MKTNTEKIFTYIDTFAESSESLYLEAIIEACDKWLAGTETPKDLLNVTNEDIRRGIQLAILKGMQKNVQPNHQMTPDSIGMIIGHLANKLTAGQSDLTLLDPAAGTGNLLYTIMNSIEQVNMAYAVEIDELLVRLSAVTAELLEQPVTFFVQDALRPLMIDPVDLVVSDLPVGYYPDDDNAASYSLMPKEGHAYSHHLFIEQSINHTKPGGFTIFIIPENLFQSEHAADLHPYFKKNALIRAILQLPDTLFKNVNHAKSILVLQKPNEGERVTKEVLLAKVPELTNKHAMALFFKKIDEWEL